MPTTTNGSARCHRLGACANKGCAAPAGVRSTTASRVSAPGTRAPAAEEVRMRSRVRLRSRVRGSSLMIGPAYAPDRREGSEGSEGSEAGGARLLACRSRGMRAWVARRRWKNWCRCCWRSAAGWYSPAGRSFRPRPRRSSPTTPSSSPSPATSSATSTPATSGPCSTGGPSAAMPGPRPSPWWRWPWRRSPTACASPATWRCA